MNTTLEHLATGSAVLNATDGQPGVILNAFAFDTASGWCEYEVETQYGVERWLRTDLIVLSELDEAPREPFDR